MPTHIATALAPRVEAALDTLVQGLARRAPELVLAFASPAHPLAAVLEAVGERFPGARVMGASSAGEFSERAEAKGAISLFALAGDFQIETGIGEGLSADPEAAVRAALGNTPRAGDHPCETVILLLDPLTGRGEEATLLAASLLGPDVPLAGGAAGDDLAMASCLVGLPGRTLSDAVVTARIRSRRPLGLGVAHGHVPLAGPYRVTRAEGSVIYELDGKPAFEVWADATQADARARGMDPRSLQPEQLGSFLLQYEAGLATGDDFKVRAPLSRNDDGSLNFACGVAQGAQLHVMQGRPEAQITSARRAAARARENLKDSVAGALVFDCICRNLILGESFKEALSQISAELGDAPLAGFETYGEIALTAGDLSGFHNTTSVVLAFPR
ncbi:MAG: FIST C-terminal domain-containing protein [Myxococcales bacterium]|nr:FIST C-terminal domain-containing protein [Myxococcales bacterium]